jgi:cation diffusion facilitator family transporter
LLIGCGLIGLVSETLAALKAERPAPDITLWSVGVVLGTVILNHGISRYEAARSRKLGSAVLAADAAHTASDAYAALAVLGGFGLVKLGLAWGDLLATLIVGVFIARTAWEVLRHNALVLADTAPLDAEALRAIVLSVEGVRGTHRIRSRGSPDHVLVDLHIHLDPALPLVEAHSKSHEVVRAIQRSLPQVMDVVVHAEPADGREQTR